MKNILTKQLLTANEKQHAGTCNFLFCKTIAALYIFSIFPGSSVAKPKVSLTVRVFNYAQVPAATISSAERDANNILGAAAVQAVWLDCLAKSVAVDSKALCDKGWSPDLPSVRLLSGQVTKQFQDFEFGFAAVPVLVTVSYEHIERRAIRDNSPSEAGVILGCVLAHELGHLLLGNGSHSSTGIMQPQWSHEQIRQAMMGGLLFTPEQAKKIREQVQPRMRLQTVSSGEQRDAAVDH